MVFLGYPFFRASFCFSCSEGNEIQVSYTFIEVICTRISFSFHTETNLAEGGRTAERNAVMLQNGVTEVGSAQSVDILLGGELVWPRHAAITFSSGVVTITPSVPNALIEVSTCCYCSA